MIQTMCRWAVALGVMLFAAVGAGAQYAHARGMEIVDGAGHPIQLKGINLGNWLVPEGYMWRFERGPQSPYAIQAHCA